MPRNTDDTAVNPAYHQAQVAKGVSEAELRKWVCDLASLYGWEWRYIRDSRAQNVAGLPDLLLWNVERKLQIWVELKVEKGKLTKSRVSAKGTLVAGQEETIESLRTAGAVVYVWRPSSWLNGDIATVLR